MDDKQRRLQAYRLTEAVFRQMRPTPTVPAEKVAPIVYDLLVDEIPVATIELALRQAKAHTRAGLDYTIRTLVPAQQGQVFSRAPIEPSPPFNPTDEERAAARATIAAARARLRGEKP